MFDPTKPADHSPLDSAEMRAQLNALNDQDTALGVRIDNIPAGPPGADGAPGQQGETGPQGLPGEVSPGQLAAAIAGTSANTNGVATLDTTFADPDAETLRLKVNELILALRRA